MPFDVGIETPAARRARLIAALRAPMPENYEWNFGVVHEQTSCGTAGCALGLAAIIWPEYSNLLLNNIFDIQIAALFDIPVGSVGPIFFNESYLYETDVIEQITPLRVADALEKVLVTPS